MKLVDRIRTDLRAAADVERAPAMQAYMKSAMPFLGVPAAAVRSITSTALRTHPPADLDGLRAAVLALWDEAEFREERYAAQNLLRHRLGRGEPALLPLHEHIAVTGAWWDHVDETARHIAALLDAHPEDTAAVVRAWSRGEDLWLRRLAILAQLGRKDRLDTALLAEVIEPALSGSEFFLRKAIGWALRQYARTDPAAVRRYVAANAHLLSGLSRREAMKHLG